MKHEGGIMDLGNNYMGCTDLENGETAPTSLTRRGFMSGAAVLGIALAGSLAGCATESTGPEKASKDSTEKTGAGTAAPDTIDETGGRRHRSSGCGNLRAFCRRPGVGERKYRPRAGEGGCRRRQWRGN